MVFLTDSSLRLDAARCAGLFVVSSRSRGTDSRKEGLLATPLSIAPARGGSMRFRMNDLDQEGTRYGH